MSAAVANLNVAIKADGTVSGVVHYNTPEGMHIKTVPLSDGDIANLGAIDDVVGVNAPVGHTLADPNAPPPEALGTVGTVPAKGRDFVLHGIPAIAPTAWQVENISSEPILSGLKGTTACEVIAPHTTGSLARTGVAPEGAGEPEFEVEWAAPKPAPVVAVAPAVGPLGEPIIEVPMGPVKDKDYTVEHPDPAHISVTNKSARGIVATEYDSIGSGAVDIKPGESVTLAATDGPVVTWGVEPAVN